MIKKSAAYLGLVIVLACGLSATPAQAQPQQLAAKTCIEGRAADGSRLGLDMRIAACSELASMEKTAFVGTYFRARLKNQAQDWIGAERDFSTALDMKPNTPAAWYDRGQIRLQHLDNPTGALADISEAIWQTRNKPRAQYFIARAQAYRRLAGISEDAANFDIDMLRRADEDFSKFLVLTAQKPRKKDEAKRAEVKETRAWIAEVLASR